MVYDDILHSGVGHLDDPPGRGSGRYEWGSGENPGQHQFDFLSEVKRLKKAGVKDADIAKMLLGEKATTTTLRAQISIETKAQRQANRARALKLLDECHGNVSEVARRMGKSESSIRSLLDPAIAERTDKYENTAKFLKQKIAEKGIIDVSSGTELYMGVPDYTKKVAIAMLEKEGYVKSWVQVPQMGTDKKTSIMVLAPPPGEGETVKDVYRRIQQQKYNIQSIQEFTPDAGKTWWVPEFPESIDSSRIMIRYAEDGGKDKDGVIELRRGVEDISLGGSQYSQVRIAVDGTHYMKGMAIYGDASEMPEGVDVIFNTNKHTGTPKMAVLKELKRNEKTGEIDRENPFGALIKSPKERDGVITAGGQRRYIGADGKEHLSVINKLQDEGDWDTWSRTLSSQFLSKQPLKLINQQLSLSIADKEAELDDILRLTNPVIKKKLLEEFASSCDANASDLSAKGFKNQAFQVILPIPDLKDNEIYAPNFADGDTVALVRYPHGGTFEIPILKVNNRSKSAQKVMKNARDAVGINPKVAERLSGADFDGDTALVIPMGSNNIAIKSTPSLGLERWDPKEIYKLPDDAPKMKNRTKQNEMGRVTNLITDMTVGGASLQEISRAVKHSMVVIDAEKHHLDYKQSAKDNDIIALKKRYQGVTANGQPKGASTILSRASASVYIDKRKEITDVSKMTPEELKAWNAGKKVYRPTGETRTSVKTLKDGTVRVKTELAKTEVAQMDIYDDARELVRDPFNKKEMAYANYANQLKALANQARREARAIKPIPVSQEAKKTYAAEVESLNAHLRIAEMNSPRERQAQVIANAMVSETFKSNPSMDYEHKQRERARALIKARAIVGARKEKIEISDREWEAIQANAISTNKLIKILSNTDQEKFKQRATPRESTTLTAAQLSLAQSMARSGMYTNKEIADRLGVSASTITRILNS